MRNGVPHNNFEILSHKAKEVMKWTGRRDQVAVDVLHQGPTGEILTGDTRRAYASISKRITEPERRNSPWGTGLKQEVFLEEVGNFVDNAIATREGGLVLVPALESPEAQRAYFDFLVAVAMRTKARNGPRVITFPGAAAAPQTVKIVNSLAIADNTTREKIYLDTGLSSPNGNAISFSHSNTDLVRKRVEYLIKNANENNDPLLIFASKDDNQWLTKEEIISKMPRVTGNRKIEFPREWPAVRTQMEALGLEAEEILEGAKDSETQWGQDCQRTAISAIARWAFTAPYGREVPPIIVHGDFGRGKSWALMRALSIVQKAQRMESEHAHPISRFGNWGQAYSSTTKDLENRLIVVDDGFAKGQPDPGTLGASLAQPHFTFAAATNASAGEIEAFVRRTPFLEGRKPFIVGFPGKDWNEGWQL